jgi:hypothetical protein
MKPAGYEPGRSGCDARSISSRTTSPSLEIPVLTLEDCIALSDLTEEEIDAIAEHEHVPEIIATELGCYLVHLPEGRQAIKAIIRDDIAAARARGDYLHSAKLKLVLRHFIEHCRQNTPPVAEFQPAAVEQQGALAERN